MGGDSTVSHYGVYGNLGVPAAANKPGSREAPLSWTDNAGNLWLFGGHGYTANEYYEDMNDLWKYNTSSNQWTWVKGDSIGDVGSIYGTPGVPNINNKPGARDRGMTWKDNSGDLWLFGGESVLGGGRRNDLWRYNIATNMWTFMGGETWGNQPANYGTRGVPAATNNPGARRYCGTWIDRNGNLWLFGGDNGINQLLTDLWKYDISTGFWTWMAGDPSYLFTVGRYGTKGVEDPLNKLWPRYASVTWTDTTGHLYLFGGWAYGPSSTTGFYNDLWRYNIATGNWAWISGDTVRNKLGVYGTQGVPNATNKPGGRAYGTGWIDSNNQLWLIGGQGYGINTWPNTFMNDLWKYNITTEQWTWVKGANDIFLPSFGTKGVSSPTNTPGGRYSSVSWMAPGDKMWLFGGQALGTNGNFFMNDLWKFEPILCIAATINSQPSNSAVCVGANTSFTISATNATSYQWQENTGSGWNNLSNNATYSGTQTNTLNITAVTIAMNNYQYRCVVNNSCGNTNSAAATLSVSAPGGIAAVTISASSNPICSGANVTFTATPVNGGSTPVYQWKKNGVNTGTNSNTYSTTTLVNGDIISCDITSSLACLATTTASSNNIVMTVNANQTATVSISASANNICAGTTVTFTAVPVNGGTAPVYQWQKNGVNVGSNSITYTTNTLVNGDIIKCVMTSNLNCVTVPAVTSNQVVMTVIANQTATVSISASANNICAGTSVTFTAVPVNGGTAPVYQWQKNGINVGSNSITYSDNSLINGDIIKCVMTSNLNCVSVSTVTSNQVVITVIANQTAAVSISASANNICAGTSVTFTAVPANGGTAPVYQWQKNGINVGSNSISYTTNSLINGDIVECVMTSNLNCVSVPTVTSNQVVMTVLTSQTATVSISASANNICAGTTITFTAASVNGGTAPVYQWQKNGINVGSNSITYSDNSLINGDVIRCVLTSNLNCVSVASVASNQVTTMVNPLVTPSIAITASANNICPGTLVTFTAVTGNGGTAPVYQWKKNGINVGSNAATYNDNGIVGSDVITCSVTSNANCLLTPGASSNGVIMVMAPNIPVSLGTDKRICSGTSIVLTAPSGYASYLWQDASTASSYTATSGGNYRVTATDNCGIVSSDDILVTEDPRPANFLPSDSSICNAVSINIGADQSFVSYLWNTGSVSPAITVNAPGQYWLEVTDNNSCKGRDSINVLPKQCFRGMYMPNAFTPAGVNKILRPTLYGTVTLYQFMVYNRYGQKVYETSDPSKGWDGTFKGEAQPHGTYVWHCIYRIDNLQITNEQGTAILIR